MTGDPTPEAKHLGDLLAERGLTIATAESMTGGAIADALVSVPGSGEWLAGGIVAYLSRVKFELLGVTPGPVVRESAAREMATGATRVLHTDVGIAVTGCAGPEPMEDQPVGTAWIGVAVGPATTTRHFVLDGAPDEIRAETVRLALRAAADAIVATA